MEQRMAQEGLVAAFLEICPTPEDLLHPDGYRDSGLALIDAIFSIRAHYSSVLNVVRRYAAFAGVQVAPLAPGAIAADQHPVSAVLERLNGMKPDAAATEVFDNQAKSHGHLKASLVLEAAERLVHAGCLRREDVALDDTTEAYAAQKQAWNRVGGLGDVTFEYFRLLCGAETVKPDVMVLRWIGRVTGTTPSSSGGHQIMRDLATDLAARWNVEQVSLRALDHTVWRHESGRED